MVAIQQVELVHVGGGVGGLGSSDVWCFGPDGS